MNPIIAAAVAALISSMGYGLKWLTAGGGMAAALVGTAVMWGGGLEAGVPLAFLFVSGSILSAATARRSASHSPATTARDHRQVLANGTWAAVGGAALAVQYPIAGWSMLAASLTAAQADTWSTEFGSFSRQLPRSIVGGRQVVPGTSGGVTWVGSAGGVAGATIMGVTVWVVGPSPAIAIVATVAGILAMLFDSLLGATVQAIYTCTGCGAETETQTHPCDSPLQLTRGRGWITNDTVNFLATGAAAALGIVILMI